jgi:hypothetical protein
MLSFHIQYVYQQMHIHVHILQNCYFTNAPTRFGASAPSSGSSYVVFAVSYEI